jgi:hypothetical protein
VSGAQSPDDRGVGHTARRHHPETRPSQRDHPIERTGQVMANGIKVRTSALAGWGLFRGAGCVPGGEAGDAAQGGETVAGSWPLAADRLGTRLARGPAKDRGDDDGVIGVAQHRDEVGYQVEGECR